MKKTYVVYDNIVIRTISTRENIFDSLKKELKGNEKIAVFDEELSIDDLKVDSGQVRKSKNKPINIPLFISQFSIKDNDAELDLRIREVFDCDPKEWKKTYYKLLRQRFYPPMEDYVDAQAKIASGDNLMIEEGKEQLNSYFSKCVLVKKRFPK